MPGAGRGCSRIALSAYREEYSLRARPHLFTHPPTDSPPPTLHNAPPSLATMATTTHQTEPRATGTGLRSSVPSDPTILWPINRCGGRGVPAAQERNSNFQQGALGMQVRGESPAFLLPGKMCPERSEVTSLLYFFFFLISACPSHSLLISLFLFHLFVFSSSLCHLTVGMSLLSPCLILCLFLPVILCLVLYVFFSLYVSFCLSPFFSLPPSLSHTLMIPP